VRTLYLDRKNAALELDGGALVIRVPGERPARVPLGGLERVVVRGAATIATGALAALHEHDVGLVLLSGRRGEPTATLLGRPHADVTIRLAQLEVARDAAARLALARRLLEAKLAGQLRLVGELLEARPDQRRPLLGARAAIEAAREKLAAAEASGLLGLEGTAAAAYFQALAAVLPPSLGFSGRNRRPPRDPVNACLSLGYALATHEAGRQAQLVGLDPLLGFLHAPVPGRPALACDLVEPVRCHVDRLVWRLFAEGRLRAEHAKSTAEGCLLGKAGREIFYLAFEAELGALPRLLRQMAAALARELRARPQPEWLSC
jgi:CRISPR-associated protein Cas1